jgi:hypothetical protein
MRRTTMSGYVARRVPWQQLAAVGLTCAPVLVVRAATAGSAFDVLPLMRLAALALAATAVLAVDDPACSVTTPTTVGRLRLRVCACVATAVPLIAVWAALLTIARATATTSQRLPLGGLLLELLVMCAAGWLIVACLAEVAGDRFVTARAAGVLVVCVGATITTPHLTHWFWVGPGSEWHRSHVRWAVVGFGAMVVFVWLSLDPARTRRTIALPRTRHTAR